MLSNIFMSYHTMTAPLLQRLPNLIADELSTMRTNTKTSVTLSSINALKKRSPNHVVLEYTATKDKKSLVFHKPFGKWKLILLV